MAEITITFPCGYSETLKSWEWSLGALRDKILKHHKESCNECKGD